MHPYTIPLALVVAILAGLFHIVPGLTRPDLFFAVTVDPAFRRTVEGRRILARYRAIVWAAAVAAVAVAVFARMPLISIAIEGAGFVWALASSHGRALAYAASPSPIREVELNAAPGQLPGWPVLPLLPLVFLAGLGLWAGTHWDRLPARLPVHWGIHGVDRWVAATPGAVFGILALPASVCLTLLGIAWGMLHWSRRISATGAQARSESQFRTRLVQLLIAVEYLLVFPAAACLFAVGNRAMTLWGALLTGTLLIFSIVLMRAGQGGSRSTPATPGPPTGDGTPDSCWKWGLFYINPADPSILVEKRFGIGYTLNLGNRWSWIMLTIVLLPAAFGLIFLR